MNISNYVEEDNFHNFLFEVSFSLEESDKSLTNIFPIQLKKLFENETIRLCPFVSFPSSEKLAFAFSKWWGIDWQSNSRRFWKLWKIFLILCVGSNILGKAFHVCSGWLWTALIPHDKDEWRKIFYLGDYYRVTLLLPGNHCGVTYP